MRPELASWCVLSALTLCAWGPVYAQGDGAEPSEEAPAVAPEGDAAQRDGGSGGAEEGARVEDESESKATESESTESESDESESSDRGEGWQEDVEARRRAEAAAQLGVLAGPESLYKRGWRGDFNLGLGLGGAIGEGEGALFVGRARGGLMRVQDPRFYTLGPTVSFHQDGGVAFGLQAESLNISTGTQLWLGAEMNLDAKPIAHVGAGLALFGLEYQAHFEGEGVSHRVFAKVRIPVSWLIYAFNRRR